MFIITFFYSFYILESNDELEKGLIEIICNDFVVSRDS